MIKTSVTTAQETPFKLFEILRDLLYLSRFPNIATLPRNITHILNMCTDTHADSYGRTILHIPMDDIDDITPHIPIILSFISSSIQSGNEVLFHCALGLNRSVAAVLAYLCHIIGLDAQKALEVVKEKKADVKPSALFLQQIDRYFGRGGEREDPLVGFKRRLEERKRAPGGGSEKMED